MSVTQRASKLQPDAAPLWLPRHGAIVVDQAASRPPDSVEGYTLQSRLTTAIFGSTWKMVTTIATTVAVVVFLATLPALLDAGITNLIKVAFYQAWTLALLLVATMRVRSVSIGTAARYWLAGMFTVAIAAYFLNGPLAGLTSTSAVWVTPPLEELLKALPLAVAVFMGRRVWRHPGLSDLMVLGFAVGAGYAFHEDALWERATVSGFEANAGLFVPSILQPDGLFVVGHAVWTAVLGLAIGLVLLHRHQPLAVVAAAFAVFVVVADHMAINDAQGTLDVFRQLLFNGKLVGLIFLAGVIASVLLDNRRLAATSARDHLFPSDRSYRVGHFESDAASDLIQPFLASRYRRLRNGMHTTADATAQQWPPRSETHPAPLAELARLGRAAAVAVGPGTSSSGWVADPENQNGQRFVGPNGFTAYAAGEVVVEPEPVLVAAPAFGPDATPEDIEAAEKQAARDAKRAAKAQPSAPTATSISTPKARSEAMGETVVARSPEYWQYLGLGAVAVGLFVVIRLLTAGDPSSELIASAFEPDFSLPDAPNSPALIRGLVGAVAAGVAIRGRNPAELGHGWEVGPGDDPRPDRPDECEA